MKRPDVTISISWRTIKFAVVIGVSFFLMFSSLAYAYGQINQTNVSASIVGWFKAEQVDNENVSLATNMNVWVNGRQFMVCATPLQPVNKALVPSY